MRNIYLFLVIFLLMSTSCGKQIKQANIPKKKPINSKKNHIPRISTEQELQNKELLQLVEHMQEFYAQRGEALDVFIARSASENNIPNWLANLKKADRMLHDCLDAITQDIKQTYLYDKKSINIALKKTLVNRMELLKQREESIQANLDINNLDNKSPSDLPTSEPLFNFLVASEPFCAHKEYYQFQRFYKVSIFEVLQLFTKLYFLNCDFKSLDSETKNLLRASAQLHPILTGERKDLGHPDEAVKGYTLLEPFLIPHPTISPASMPNCKILIDGIKSRPLAHASDSKCQDWNNLILLIRMYNTIAHSNKDNINISQELLNIRKNIDLEIWKAHFEPRVQANQLKEANKILTLSKTQLKLRKKLEKEGSKLQTDFQAGVWPFELPNPYFLKNSLKKEDFLPLHHLYSNRPAIKKMDENHLHTKQQEEQWIEKADHLTTQMEQVKIAHSSIIPHENVATSTTVVDKAPQEAILTCEQDIIQPIDPNDNRAMIETAIEKDEEHGIEESKQEELATNNSEIEIATELISNRLATRGSRIFHEFRPVSTPSLLQMPNKHQKIVDKFFNPQQQCSVTFREFRTVWEGIGGKLYSGGGSHHALYNATGQRISYGIFMHGENQTYGKKSIKYIQEILLSAGFVSSE